MEGKVDEYVNQNDEKIISQDNISLQNQSLQLSSNKHLIQFKLLKGTVWADTITNKQFIINHGKLTIALLVFIMILRLLPSPLIINIVEHDPQLFDKEECSDQSCINQVQGYQTVILKKINPFHRELKFFVHLNNQKIKRFEQITGITRVDISDQITYAQIYASREGAIYGDVIQETDGSETYEILFNGEPLIYIGKVYILQEASYMLKIYKLIHKYQRQVTRNLQELDDYSNTQSQTKTPSSNETKTNSSEQSGKDNQTNSKNQTNINSNQTDINENNKTDVNKTQIDKDQNETKNQTRMEQKQTSAPLSIHLVRYSEFFTSFQLIVRYVTFLYILYVRAETKASPLIFHFILLATSNPLIFTQIAFPNNASNIISLMCNSMYIFYMALFLDFTHRQLRNYKIDILIRVLKLILTIALYFMNILRQTYYGNKSTLLEIIQYTIFCIVAIPIFEYLWRIYFIKSRTILHRNLIFISLTIYYGLLLFFSSYLVQYGWRKISMYLIIQFYGIKLCYLTSPIKKYNNDIQEEDILRSFQSKQVGSQKKENKMSDGQQFNEMNENSNKNGVQNQNIYFVQIKQHHQE